jgi:hypothetical protein
MKHLLIYSFLLCCLTGNTQKMDHSSWTAILQSYVTDKGDVNYKSLQNNRTVLNGYLNAIASNVPDKNWSTSEKKAYWINAYNAYTVQLILDNYPIQSIKDLKDPWGQKFITLNDETLTLNTIEHKILRPMGDSRIHFAIVCASESCPKLLNCAFEAETIDSQLDQAAHEFINDPTKNSITPSKITISKIFKWFKSDFPKGVDFINYLNTYSTVQISPEAKINHQNYNWALNE